MGRKHPGVDAYIARAAPFARPILRHLREVVHAGCPDVVEELKWNSPHFRYKGMFCGMASFKAHATFGFWKHALLEKDLKALGSPLEEAMGQFGRLASVDDLPSRRTMLALVRKAAKLNDLGVKNPTRVRRARPKPVVVPPDLAAALRGNAKARATFQALSPGNRRDYVEWITEAKREETRRRRLATAIEWMAEGKIRNWKYVRK